MTEHQLACTPEDPKTKEKTGDVFTATQSALQSISINQAEFKKFCQLLGKDPASTRIRAIPHKTDGSNQLKAQKGNWSAGLITRLQQGGLGIYAVINEGGDCKADIDSCVAFFVEWDDKPVEWQIQAWQEFGLPEPTFTVLTGGKSAHLYWVLEKPVSPETWEPIQAGLLAHLGGDPSIKDCSRVMRAPGCWYIGPDRTPMKQTTIIAAPGHRYTVEDMGAALPQQGTDTQGPATCEPASTTETKSSSLRTRSMQEVQSALQAIPQRVEGTNTYPKYRNILWGLIAACEEAGDTDKAAIVLMEAHSPSQSCGWDIKQVAASRNGKIQAGTFWWHARQAGWQPDGASTKKSTAPKSAGSKKASGNSEDKCQRVTLANDEILALLPERIGQPRLNVRTQAIHLPKRVISGNEANHLYLELSSKTEVWRKTATADALEALAKKNRFDPADDYLMTHIEGVEPLPMKEWRSLDQLLLNIDDPIAAAYLPRYLIAAVARIKRPGCQVDQCPVLIGPQGIGKSRLGKALFGAQNYGDQLSQRLDVDDVTRLHRFWAVELAELDGITRRSDQESLKAFLTRDTDTERRKYGKNHEDLPRRIVFWGTSNAAPLRDPTGSRRFVCIQLPNAALPVDMVKQLSPQIWARAVQQYYGGVKWYSSPEEVKEIIDRNKDHQQEDPWEDIILGHLSKDNIIKRGAVTTKELYAILEINSHQQNNTTSKRIRQIVESAGWKYLRKSNYRAFYTPSVTPNA